MKVWTVFLILSLLASLAAYVVLLLQERGFHPIRIVIEDMKRQTVLTRIIFGIAFIGMWVYGSVKPGTIGKLLGEGAAAVETAPAADGSSTNDAALFLSGGEIVAEAEYIFRRG